MAHDVPIRVDHVGIAVPSIADAEPVLEALGCEKLLDERVPPGSDPPPDGDARLRWAYYRLGDASRLELVEPVAPDSAIRAFLDREGGPGLHHVTLEVADLDSVVATVSEAGFQVVDRAAYDGWREAFLSPRNPTGVLFQFMEYADSFHEGRRPPEELFVNGARVDTAAATTPSDGETP